MLDNEHTIRQQLACQMYMYEFTNYLQNKIIYFSLFREEQDMDAKGCSDGRASERHNLQGMVLTHGPLYDDGPKFHGHSNQALGQI